MWEREEEFRALLRRCATKASKDKLDTLADIAVRDDKHAYKHVCALVRHEMKQFKPKYRLKLLYALSAILRQSKQRRGERDKYGPRFAPQLDALAELLAAAPADHLPAMLRIFDIWFRDEIFEAAQVASLQQRFRALLQATQGGAAGSSGAGPQLAASANGAAASSGALPPHLQQHSSPGLRLSSMSPGSFSAGAPAGARTASTLGQLLPTAAPPSQGSMQAPPAPGNSLTSAPAGGALRTVGSSSQLLPQQHSSEAPPPQVSEGAWPAGSMASRQQPPLPSLAAWQQQGHSYQQQQQLQQPVSPAVRDGPDVPPPPPPPPAAAADGRSVEWQGQPPLPPPPPPAADISAPPPPPLPDATQQPAEVSGSGEAGRKRKSRWD